MWLLDQCQALFNTSSLYGVLGVSKEATDAEIRHSYYKVSLRVHPDRAPEDLQATEKFQVGKCHLKHLLKSAVSLVHLANCLELYFTVFTPFFQVLGKLYAVLSDKEQRAMYDEQGLVAEESDSLQQDQCWEEYWRLRLPK